MVVAMNKIDKPGIDVSESQTKIENELIEQGIIPEGVAADSEYGSPVQFFPISAKNGDGLDDLIEGLALQSEIMDLRADDTARAEGIVMDARVEQGLGVVVDCIVRWGSIKQGDVVVSGTDTGKVRILKDGKCAWFLRNLEVRSERPLDNISFVCACNLIRSLPYLQLTTNQSKLEHLPNPSVLWASKLPQRLATLLSALPMRKSQRT